MDSLNAIKTGKLLLASVEEYIDCCEDGGCDGGIYGEASYECIVDIGGLALASVYVSPDHKCLNDTFPAAIKINGGKIVTPSGNETELAYAVAMQPVVAAIDAGHISFQMYASGVYYEPDCSTIRLDHTVLVVGYGVMHGGDEFWICQNTWGEWNNSVFLYSLPMINGFSFGLNIYYCNRSFYFAGTSWGMQGYVYMARNRGNNCGIATNASYPF